MSVFLIMLDGVSADTFRQHAGRMPNLQKLAAHGLSIDRLTSLVPGISLPGRTSILTGRSAAEAGVYGNRIFDSGSFRYASPDDVLVPTIARHALDAGKSVASIGFGMVRPEDATLFRRPWWVDDFVQRERDDVPEPSGEGWYRVHRHRDARLAGIVEAAGYPADYPARFSDRRMYGLLGDMHVANWAGLIGAAERPDLLLCELLMTDSVQHREGYGSEQALWSVSYADALIGIILERLGDAAADYNFVVLSDHGHWHVESALRPAWILPGFVTDCEGALLHVAVDGMEAEVVATAALARYGVKPFPNDYLPEKHRRRVRSFLAPDGMSFEPGPASGAVTEPDAVSSHGLRPGHPADDRFLVLSGPAVGPGLLERATAGQVAPTVAALLGLPAGPYPETSLL